MEKIVTTKYKKDYKKALSEVARYLLEIDPWANLDRLLLDLWEFPKSWIEKKYPEYQALLYLQYAKKKMELCLLIEKGYTYLDALRLISRKYGYSLKWLRKNTPPVEKTAHCFANFTRKVTKMYLNAVAITKKSKNPFLSAEDLVENWATVKELNLRKVRKILQTDNF